MEVILDRFAGFCFGVKRAVDTVYDLLNTPKAIYTYGPIVHNEEVVSNLEEKGVRVIRDEEELKKLTAERIYAETGRKSAVLVIRAHGVPRHIYDLAKENSLEIVDATCPFVKKIHNIAEENRDQGMHIVIAGNPDHPEVIGIRDRCGEKATVIETPEDAEKFRKNGDEKVCLVAQTTFNYNKFQDIVEIFKKKGYNDNVVNTICNATQERQRSARAIAAKADAMIVIGGRNSSNTRKLYEICLGECPDTYYIQSLDDLHLELPKAVRLVGITAGASTPNKLIEEVQNYVRINF